MALTRSKAIRSDLRQPSPLSLNSVRISEFTYDLNEFKIGGYEEKVQ